MAKLQALLELIKGGSGPQNPITKFFNTEAWRGQFLYYFTGFVQKVRGNHFHPFDSPSCNESDIFSLCRRKILHLHQTTMQNTFSNTVVKKLWYDEINSLIWWAWISYSLKTVEGMFDVTHKNIASWFLFLWVLYWSIRICFSRLKEHFHLL